MATFLPFAGVRYDLDRVDLVDVVAPPYDVIDAAARARLEARSPYNAVRVELADDRDGEQRYEAIRRRLDGWMAEGILRRDPEPGFYVYRMGWHDDQGRALQTTGVLGALEVSTPALGQVLPHERTMGKPKDDRLSLLRATRTNLSAVWGLSLANGLSDLLDVSGPPLARCTDEDGVHHRLWHVTQPATLAAITDAVGSAPVMIADGHHRYETALAYADERAAASGGARGDFDLLLAFVVELSDEQLEIRPIHRLLRGLPEGFDLAGGLAPYFDVVDAGGLPVGSRLIERMAGDGGLGLLEADRAWLLMPRNGSATDPDSARLDAALATLPSHELGFHHAPAAVVEMVRSGDAQAGVLLRPVPVDQIAATARAGRRMPEKTTFFAPKPRTGLVFRRLDD
ncbi:MAG: hypothetical protein QOD63_2084 [Actinomycetota bacterium]|jgi:uncharacterized protein (DUF1015 family)|nr:hypothetical protein [Actinomycetota bacterium]